MNAAQHIAGEGLYRLLKRKMGWLAGWPAVLAIALALAGCSGDKSPGRTLQDAMVKAADIKSYAFKGSLKVEAADIPAGGLPSDGLRQMSALLALAKNADVSWTGVYSADPMRMEMNLQIALKGGAGITVQLPILMTKDKLWVKIPNLPPIIPPEAAGKYLEIDGQQLAGQGKQGVEIPRIDPGESRKFVDDLIRIIAQNVDEKTYLSSPSLKDAGVPEDAGIDKVVRLRVAKEQAQPFLQTAAEKIAPAVLDLLKQNEAYRSLLSLKPEQVELAGRKLDQARSSGDLAKTMEPVYKAVQQLDITVDIGIDGDGYPSYSLADVAAKWTAPDGKPASLAFRTTSQQSNINGQVKFPSGDGAPTDIVTPDRLSELLGALAATGSGP